jgi:hypothetical protein
LNPPPTEYKTVALPDELFQLINYCNSSFILCQELSL